MASRPVEPVAACRRLATALLALVVCLSGCLSSACSPNRPYVRARNVIVYSSIHICIRVSVCVCVRACLPAATVVSLPPSGRPAAALRYVVGGSSAPLLLLMLLMVATTSTARSFSLFPSPTPLAPSSLRFASPPSRRRRRRRRRRFDVL